MVLLRRALSDISWLVPIFILTAVLGLGLVQGSERGAKWLVVIIIGYLGIASGILFKDKRLFAVCLVAACIPIGFQYNLWTHGNKFSFIDHFGGAINEPVINLVDIPIFILFLVWLVDMRSNLISFPKWTGLDSLICLLLGWSLFSVYNTEAYLFFIFEVLRYLKYLGLYWMLRTYLKEPKYFWAIIAVSVSILLVQGLVSLMQYFMHFQFPIPVGGVTETTLELVDNEVIQKVTGILGHSNTFSAYLMVICSMCLILLFSRIKTLYKLAVIPMLLAGLLSLTLTFSRNGWMVFVVNAVGIGFWALKTKRLKMGHVLSLGAFVIFLMGILFSSGIFDTILTRVFRADDGAFDSRADLVLVAAKMIESHPVIGIGLNSFEENMIHYDPNHITHIIKQPVHNGFLLVAAETGIPALIILILIVVGYLKMSRQILRKDSELNFAVGLTGMVTFGGLALSNLFDVTLRKESVSGIIVLIAALVASLHFVDQNEVDKKPT